MKKISVSIIFLIFIFILYFIQVGVFSNFGLFGVMPNLFIILVLYIGLFTNSVNAICFGIIIGIFLDLLYGNTVGLSAVMFCIVGYIASYFDKNFSKENKVTILLMSIGATIIYEFGFYSLNGLILGYDFEWFKFIRIILFEIIYNSLITIILYPFIQKSGYKIDRIYKKNNILTRYF
ncbi:MAG: rod shape-determining protein MreD [Clostridia bacterium]|nr:rod shape-determining protein MreD [Clostridia bacterium]